MGVRGGWSSRAQRCTRARGTRSRMDVQGRESLTIKRAGLPFFEAVGVYIIFSAEVLKSRWTQKRAGILRKGRPDF
jgi:hypothetical protein